MINTTHSTITKQGECLLFSSGGGCSYYEWDYNFKQQPHNMERAFRPVHICSVGCLKVSYGCGDILVVFQGSSGLDFRVLVFCFTEGFFSRRTTSKPIAHPQTSYKDRDLDQFSDTSNPNFEGSKTSNSVYSRKQA